MAVRMKLNKGYTTLLDREDYVRLREYTWFVKDNGTGGKLYVVRKYGPRKKRRIEYMARNIIDAPKGLYVDHINGDTLDNRKRNLRLCTTQQNAGNSIKPRHGRVSKYKGVQRMPPAKKATSKKWFAQIHIDGKCFYLGSAHTEKGAARLYDKAAVLAYGKFARLNFPDTEK